MRQLRPQMFDQKESYNTRLRLFKEFMTPEQKFTDHEKNFLLTNQSSYYRFLIDVCEKIAKSRRTLKDEEFIVLRSYTISVEVFAKNAFRQITSQVYFNHWTQLLQQRNGQELQEKAFIALCKALTKEALKLEEWQGSFFDCLQLDY